MSDADAALDAERLHRKALKRKKKKKTTVYDVSGCHVPYQGRMIMHSTVQSFGAISDATMEHSALLCACPCAYKCFNPSCIGLCHTCLETLSTQIHLFTVSWCPERLQAVSIRV